MHCLTLLMMRSLTDSLMLNYPDMCTRIFYAFLSVSRNYPIAVRSSSKLEDSHYQPFAGIYSTYMIPRLPDNKEMVKMLSDAIKRFMPRLLQGQQGIHDCYCECN